MISELSKTPFDIYEGELRAGWIHFKVIRFYPNGT